MTVEAWPSPHQAIPHSLLPPSGYVKSGYANLFLGIACSSVAKSCLTLQLHGLEHARLLCPPLSPRVFSVSWPLSQWCYLTIVSSTIAFFFCLQSFPASGSFPMSWFFATHGQNIGASALAIVLPMNIQGWFPLGLTGLISLLSKGLSRVFSSTTIWKHQFFGIQPTLRSNSHIHRWLTGKTIVSTIWAFVAKVMSLLFNTLSRFVTVFLPRSKHF